jgi:uncharacterized protein
MSPLHLVIAGVAGFLAGGVNALAGGGTLLSFPVLIAVGLPPVSANVTNTVALSPGYLGGVLSQKGKLAEQRRRIRRLSAAAALGGLAGSILLLVTSDSVFRNLVPVLILVATLLLAAQDPIRAALKLGGPVRTAAPAGGGAPEAGPGDELPDPAVGDPRVPDVPATVSPADPRWLPVPVFVVSIYGGYFGAGLGIMLLAVLGSLLHDPLPRINALKQVMAFVINVTAAAFFLTSHRVWWLVALVMAVASLAGGAAGGHLAGAVQPVHLRRIVVGIGLAVAVGYGAKTWL